MRTRSYGRSIMPLTVAVMLFLYAPLLIVVVYAFNGGRNLSWPPQGLSLQWFSKLWTDPDFRSAIGTSVITATAAAVLATLLGTGLAVVVTRRRTRAAQIFEALGRLPVMLPPLLIGAGLVALMRLTSIDPGYVTIILGQAVLALPFTVIVIAASLRHYEIELESAARDLGARPWAVIRRVMLPLIGPAVLGAALLAFAIAFDEVLLTNFTSGFHSTVPIYVFGHMRRQIDPSINAVATILLLIPWIALAVGAFVFRRTATQKPPKSRGD